MRFARLAYCSVESDSSKLMSAPEKEQKSTHEYEGKKKEKKEKKMRGSAPAGETAASMIVFAFPPASTTIPYLSTAIRIGAYHTSVPHSA
eukprot:2191635-Rhodomonas_salina.1